MPSVVAVVIIQQRLHRVALTYEYYWYLVETYCGVDVLFAWLVSQAITVTGENGLWATALTLTTCGAYRYTLDSLEETQTLMWTQN